MTLYNILVLSCIGIICGVCFVLGVIYEAGRVAAEIKAGMKR